MSVVGSGQWILRACCYGAMKTNCLIFAVALFFRRHARISKADRDRREGRITRDLKLCGRRHYIAMRWSDLGRFPHFLYVEKSPHSGVRQISYKPKRPVERYFPPALFDGFVKWGD